MPLCSPDGTGTVRAVPYDVRTGRADPRALAAVRAETARPRLGADIVRLLDMVWPMLREQNVRTGHNVVVYRAGDGGTMTIDAGVEVFTDFTERGEVRHISTPSGDMYYSRGFPFCVRAAALRDAMLMAAGYMLSPPSGRRLSGGCLEEPGAVVVPAGGGLVASPPQRPAQGGREPGAGEQPGGGLPGQCGEPGGLGDR